MLQRVATVLLWGHTHNRIDGPDGAQAGADGRRRVPVAVPITFAVPFSFRASLSTDVSGGNSGLPSLWWGSFGALVGRPEWRPSAAAFLKSKRSASSLRAPSGKTAGRRRAVLVFPSYFLAASVTVDRDSSVDPRGRVARYGPVSRTTLTSSTTRVGRSNCRRADCGHALAQGRPRAYR
jgi:hypothetical protein